MSKQIIKQFNEEDMVAIEPLYINIEEVDAHGDGMLLSEIRKMVEDFNTNIDNIQGNIHHQYMTQGFQPVKAWVNEVDCYIGETLVPEGQPIVKVQFHDSTLWEARKDGELRGLSIGATGERIPNPDYEG